MVLDNFTVMWATDELIDDDFQSNSTSITNSSNITNFPDYDVNDSFSHFEWAELAPVLVVYTLTFFLGLIGKFNFQIQTIMFNRKYLHINYSL